MLYNDIKITKEEKNYILFKEFLKENEINFEIIDDIIILKYNDRFLINNAEIIISIKCSNGYFYCTSEVPEFNSKCEIWKSLEEIFNILYLQLNCYRATKVKLTLLNKFNIDGITTYQDNKQNIIIEKMTKKYRLPTRIRLLISPLGNINITWINSELDTYDSTYIRYHFIDYKQLNDILEEKLVFGLINNPEK